MELREATPGDAEAVGRVAEVAWHAAHDETLDVANATYEKPL